MVKLSQQIYGKKREGEGEGEKERERKLCTQVCLAKHACVCVSALPVERAGRGACGTPQAGSLAVGWGGWARWWPARPTPSSACWQTQSTNAAASGKACRIEDTGFHWKGYRGRIEIIGLHRFFFSSWLVHWPYYSSPEEAEKHIESQGSPDYKVVDPRPMPCVQSKLEEQRKASECTYLKPNTLHICISWDEINTPEGSALPLMWRWRQGQWRLLFHTTSSQKPGFK